MYLLVNPDGAKYWRLKRRVAGREKKLSLGVYPEVTLKEAREKLAAALTLLRGFVAAGSPRATADKLGSFDVWDGRVRQAVPWVGAQGLTPEGASAADPVRAIEAAKAVEPERQKLAAFPRAAHGVMGDGRWRAAELIKHAQTASLDTYGADESATVALQEAIEEIAEDRGRINPRILRRWIERHANRRCDGLWIERDTTVKLNTAAWRVRGEKKSVS